MVRGLVVGALAFAAAFATERQFAAIGKDLKRFDALRAMSGDPPFMRDVVKSATAALTEFGASRKDQVRELFTSLTSDLVRYAAMRRM